MSEFSVAWGKRGEGGQGREGVQLPDSLMDLNLLDRIVVSFLVTHTCSLLKEDRQLTPPPLQTRCDSAEGCKNTH